jgi:hypothetical protein
MANWVTSVRTSTVCKPGQCRETMIEAVTRAGYTTVRLHRAIADQALHHFTRARRRRRMPPALLTEHRNRRTPHYPRSGKWEQVIRMFVQRHRNIQEAGKLADPTQSGRCADDLSPEPHLAGRLIRLSTTSFLSRDQQGWASEAPTASYSWPAASRNSTES